MDKWDRITDFGCSSCMFYVPKKEHSVSGGLGLPSNPKPGCAIYETTAAVVVEEGRCRRNAPTMKGYPVVFAEDWCGEHKRGSNPVRDKEVKNV